MAPISPPHPHTQTHIHRHQKHFSFLAKNARMPKNVIHPNTQDIKNQHVVDSQLREDVISFVQDQSQFPFPSPPTNHKNGNIYHLAKEPFNTPISVQTHIPQN